MLDRSDKFLSVIVPYFEDPRQPYLRDRVLSLIDAFPAVDSAEFIISETILEPKVSSQLADVCRERHIRYISHIDPNPVFSRGTCRDIGAQQASGKVLAFFDIDFRAPSDFWTRLIAFAELYKIPRRKKSFFVVPIMFLTREGTSEFERRIGDERFEELYLKWLFGDVREIDFMALCSSILVVGRHYYLSRGGNRTEFTGHGFEDFELLHRLMAEENIFPRPHNYEIEQRHWNAVTRFEGFRAGLSLLGRAALLSNLHAVHLWHPRPAMTTKGNLDLFRQCVRDFGVRRDHPNPLVAKVDTKHRTLFLGKSDAHVVKCMRDAIPLLGEMSYVSETVFADGGKTFSENRLKQTIDELGITRLLFHNPYATAIRHAIYAWCRDRQFPFLVFERGALLDSWFFDDKGFNGDSASYQPDQWDTSPTESERLETIERIRNELSKDQALEGDAQRRGGAALSQILGIRGRKVLFAPLQRRSDTVVKHLSGDIEGYSKFLRVIDEIAMRIEPFGWAVVCKQHPLESAAPKFTSAIIAPSNTHFMDLLELSSAVALINSGVGLYAMMMQKPCYIFGKAFYDIPEANTSIENYNVEELFKKLLSPQHGAVNFEKIVRFLKYLYKEFYSFGTSRSFLRATADGSLTRVTTSVDFHTISIPGLERLRYETSPSPQVRLSAPIFERFRLDIDDKISGNRTFETFDHADAPEQEHIEKKLAPSGQGRILQTVSRTGTRGGSSSFYGNVRTVRGALARVMTSIIGSDNWTSRQSPADRGWDSVCWSPELGVFVAVASGGTGMRVMTSENGVDWVLRATPIDNKWRGICWSKELGLFVAVAVTGGTKKFMTSPDGVSWTVRKSPPAAFSSVCWSKERKIFCAVNLDLTGFRVATSGDGVRWRQQATPSPHGDLNWQSICWSPELGLFCAVAMNGIGNRAMTSPDGISWTLRATPDTLFRSVCWAPALNTFVAVGDGGSSGRISTSPDGVSWTARGSDAVSCNSVCWSPTHGLLCTIAKVGSESLACVSTNGITWESHRCVDNNVKSICCSPELNIFCAVGN